MTTLPYKAQPYILLFYDVQDFLYCHRGVTPFTRFSIDVLFVGVLLYLFALYSDVLISNILTTSCM